MSAIEPAPTSRRPVSLAIVLIGAGSIGLWAAFMLTLDKIDLVADPEAQLACNVSVLVGCAANLSSWQGSLFGFPNPLLGLACWTAVIAAGAAVLAAPRLARWFWLALNAGIVMALGLVIFFITHSITVINILCPWCMVTWAVTIPTFWAVTFYNVKEGHFDVSDRARLIARALYAWTPLITLACYAIVAVLAQLQLDWIHRAFV